MTYTRFYDEWKSSPDTSTPITKEALTRFDEGIEAAHLLAMNVEGVRAPKAGATKVFGTGTGNTWWDWFGNGTTPMQVAEKKQGAGSLQMTLAADGAAQLYKTLPVTAFDMSGHSVRLWLMCTDWSGVGAAQVRFSTTDNDFYFVNVRNEFSVNHFTNNVWVEVNLPLSAFTAQGSPNWTSIVDAGVQAWGQDAATPTVYFNHITIVPSSGEAVVSLTFDDGYDSMYSAAQIMDEYGYVGTTYIAPDWVDQPGFMNQEQIEDLHERGWEIAGHGSGNLNNLTNSEAEASVAAAATYLAKHGFRGKKHYAYPNGGNSERIHAIVRKYFSTGRTINAVPQPQGYISEYVINSLGPWRDLPVATITDMIDAAITNGEWLILTFHKVLPVATDPDLDYTEANFRAVLDHIRASGVKVDSIGGVLG